MNLSAQHRREVLRLFNVAEVARQLNVDAQWLRRTIKAGAITPPSTRLGLRLYFSADDLATLSTQLNANRQ